MCFPTWLSLRTQVEEERSARTAVEGRLADLAAEHSAVQVNLTLALTLSQP